MRNSINIRGNGLADRNGIVPPRRKFGTLLRSDPNLPTPPIAKDDNFSHYHSGESSAAASPMHYDGAAPSSAEASPLLLSPYTKSPWILKSSPPLDDRFSEQTNSPIGSMVREEGHVYSLAASDGDSGLLYTGSDSKNIRVWKNLKEFSGFKSSSGLVKAIVIWGDKVFTGHQDGKIRVWRVGSRNPAQHKRVGSLPTLKDYITASMNPKNYVEVRRRHKTVIRIRHYDAVSCLSLNRERGLLYSGSWDRTLKVWRLSDSKCLESIDAHDDAVNAVVAGFDDLVFTGSADGTAKAWRRHLNGKRGTTHFFAKLLMRSEFAVTALAVNHSSGVVYGGSSDGLVNFWEREKLLSHGGVLRGHKLAVLCLAVGGRFVFSGSSDKTICVWRRDGEAGHTCLSVLSGHTGPVKCLAAREDLSAEEGEGGRRWIVYSGSLDKSVKVWRVAEKADFPRPYALDKHAPPISPLERR